MYKHGKPIYKISRRPIIFIIAGVLILAGLAYLAISKIQAKDSLSNSDKPLVSTVKVADQNTLVNEANFTFSLPGKWQLSAKDWDARYRAWQWKFMDTRYAGRIFMVYLDTIPSDYAYNYLLPVTAEGDSLQLGQTSGNCADFTTTNQTHTNASGTVAAPSKWQGVNFLCDYGRRQTLQVVGTSSPDGINSVTLKGPSAGSHKFFFLYEDNNISPDLGVIDNILSTFHAK